MSELAAWKEQPVKKLNQDLNQAPDIPDDPVGQLHWLAKCTEDDEAAIGRAAGAFLEAADDFLSELTGRIKVWFEIKNREPHERIRVGRSGYVPRPGSVVGVYATDRIEALDGIATKIRGAIDEINTTLDETD